MNETEIRNQVHLLLKALGDDEELQNGRTATMTAACNLLAQFLVDINRIASHFERGIDLAEGERYDEHRR